MRFARTLTALLGVLLSVVVYGRASGVTQQPPASEYLLAAGRAGRIELGTSVDEMYQFFGRDNVRLVDLFKEGLFSPALEVKLAGTTVVPAVVTDIREWPCGEFSVWGIDVRDPRFRTKDGFGVGSTAGDLRRSYPFQVSEEEGGHAAIVKALQMSFSLTRQGPADQQRVTSVWIWPDPDAVRKKRCPGRDGNPVTFRRPPNPQMEPTRRSFATLARHGEMKSPLVSGMAPRTIGAVVATGMLIGLSSW